VDREEKGRTRVGDTKRREATNHTPEGVSTYVLAHGHLRMQQQLRAYIKEADTKDRFGLVVGTG
jgi:hypothetical protein